MTGQSLHALDVLSRDEIYVVMLQVAQHNWKTKIEECIETLQGY